MKTKINIICALIISLIIASALAHLFAVGAGFGYGWTSVQEENEKSSGLLPYPSVLMLEPEKPNGFQFETKLTNSEYAKLQPTSALLYLPENCYDIKEHLFALTLGSVVFPLFYGIAAIWAIILFLKLVFNVNKDYIFEHRNVKLMRRISALLIVGGFCTIAGEIITALSAHGISHLVEGVEISPVREIPWLPILLGLISLLLAEIWNRAIVMKEEQALTI